MGAQFWSVSGFFLILLVLMPPPQTEAAEHMRLLQRVRQALSSPTTQLLGSHAEVARFSAPPAVADAQPAEGEEAANPEGGGSEPAAPTADDAAGSSGDSAEAKKEEPTRKGEEAGDAEETDDIDVWGDEDLENCCEYEKLEDKRLRGGNLAKPKDSLAEAKELCDHSQRCQGIVKLSESSSNVPEVFRGKFALKGGQSVVDGEEGTVLYKKGGCPKRKASACARDREQSFEEDAMNATNATNATANATTFSASGCVTAEDPRAAAWLEKTAPVGTPCVFGVDVRDEGRHCILEGGVYGTFGWCHTKADKSQWGSCSEACPLFGHPKKLGDKLDVMSDMMHNMQEFLRNKLGYQPPEENATEANATTSEVGSAGQASAATEAAATDPAPAADGSVPTPPPPTV